MNAIQEIEAINEKRAYLVGDKPFPVKSNVAINVPPELSSILHSYIS